MQCGSSINEQSLVIALDGHAKYKSKFSNLVIVSIIDSHSVTLNYDVYNDYMVCWGNWDFEVPDMKWVDIVYKLETF